MAGISPKNRGNRSADRTGQIVSRRLRKAGYNISPSDRRNKADGTFVRGAHGFVSILIDMGGDGSNQLVQDDLCEYLRGVDWAEDIKATDMGVARLIRFTYTARPTAIRKPNKG